MPVDFSMAHSQATKEQAATLRAQGVSMAEIGRRLSIPSSTIRSWVSPAGQAYAKRQKEDPERRVCYAASVQRMQAKPGYEQRKTEYYRAYSQIPEVIARRRARERTPEHREYAREYQKKYRQEPGRKERKREYMREYVAKRRATDHAFYVLYLMRARTYKALKESIKSASTEELLGIPASTLQKYWDAEHGPDWRAGSDLHIDHIRPCASFDLIDPAQQRLCFNYRNLQLLPATENIRKGDSWSKEAEKVWSAHMRVLGWTGELYLVYEAEVQAGNL